MRAISGSGNFTDYIDFSVYDGSEVPGEDRGEESDSAPSPAHSIPDAEAAKSEKDAMKSKLGLWLILGCWLGFIVQPAWADGIERDGIGAIPIGRGGNNVASFDNGVIIYDNPAGMANIQSQGLAEVGADGLFTNLSFSSPLNDHASSRQTPWALPFLSFIQRSEDGKFAYGVGLFAPAGFGSDWKIDSPLLGLQRYKSIGAQIDILPALAYHITDRLSIGANVGPGITYAQLTGPFVLQTGALQGTPALFNLHATGVTAAWSVGLQYLLGERTTLGLSYIAQQRYNLHGDAQVEVEKISFLPVSIYSRFNADVDVTFPRSLSGGITHAFGEQRQHVGMLQLMWFDWKDAFNNIGLRLTDSSNSLVPQLAGPAIQDRFPLNWMSTISVRLGYEYHLDWSQVFRCGFVYHPNPIPSQTLTPYIPATLMYAVSAGYSKQWNNWALNIAYQYNFGAEQSVAQSGLVGGDFNNSSIGAQANWLSLSVMYRF